MALQPNCFTCVLRICVCTYFQSTFSECKLCTYSLNIVSNLYHINSYDDGMTFTILCQSTWTCGSSNQDLHILVQDKSTKRSKVDITTHMCVDLSMAIGNVYGCHQINSGEFKQIYKNCFILGLLLCNALCYFYRLFCIIMCSLLNEKDKLLKKKFTWSKNNRGVCTETNP
jgi:hypothetical protein